MSSYMSMSKSSNLCKYVHDMVIDHCINDDNGIWAVADEVGAHEYSDEKDEKLDMEETERACREDFFSSFHEKRGIVFADSANPNYMKNLYSDYLAKAISLVKPLMALLNCINTEHPNTRPHMIQDMYNQMYYIFKTKMESLCVLFAYDLLGKAIVLDVYDDDKEESLFSPGVIGENDYESSSSEDDSSSVAPSENEPAVTTFLTAKQEIEGCYYNERHPNALELAEEAKLLVQDLADMKGSVDEIWGIQDKVDQKMEEKVASVESKLKMQEDSEEHESKKQRVS